jgi:hypothetical protein
MAARDGDGVSREARGMHEISVVASASASGWECDVAVREGDSVSRHTVGVSRDELVRFGRPGETPDSLVERSVRFLLERESAASIMRRFDLTVITRFFPDYATTIRRDT